MKNHMTLFDMDKVSEVECEKTRDTDNDGVRYDAYEYHSDSTVQTSENFRYCSKLWDEFYEVNWDPWVNYQVFDGSNGCLLVEISRPEAVTVNLPNDRAKFGKDAGRKKDS